MILIQKISKQYGDQVIFDDVSFCINPRERVGLVGRNGHGKTTLFNLITGKEPCDKGTISLPKDYRIGYLSQHISFSAKTVLEEGCLGLPKHENLNEWKVKKVLAGLGFLEEDFLRDPLEFSGGYKIRLNLAKVLVSNPNLLLLDEPTNFLDIVSIRWLERFLNSWRGECVIVSHDRCFMDSVVTHIVGIHRKNVKKCTGLTGNYYERVSKEEEVYEKQRINIEKKHKKTNEFINKFRAKARRASLVQSRVKRIRKEQELEKLDKISTLSFSFNFASFPAKYVMDIADLSFSYSDDSPKLIDNFNLAVAKNDRICIIGKNGKGKTTLLKLLAERLNPKNGQVRYHPQTKKAYFEQGDTANLRDDLSVEEEILSCRSGSDNKRSRDICGLMMFSGDNALKKISVLSGGERCRVLLGKMLVTPANVLLLDEPTHHLDMESCEGIIDAVDNFDGASVIVTHNEEFLYRVAKKLIVFHDNGLFIYHGGYEDFLDEVGWGDTNGDLTKEKSEDKNGINKSVSIKQKKKARAEFINRRSRVLTPYKNKIPLLEKEIEEREKVLKEKMEALIDASNSSNISAISELSRFVQELQGLIDTGYEELGKTTEVYEEKIKEFEEEEKMF